jgi:cysteine desulfurase/selenocysteine lyase
MVTRLSTFDAAKIRKDFPILSAANDGRQVVYLDNAATTHKPASVISTIKKFYEQQNSNIHRGQYQLSIAATEAYERARNRIKEFINAEGTEEIIFTKGTTESINLLASCFGKAFLQENDEIIISEMEHHANIVPWQIACNEKGACLRVIPINDNGELCLDVLDELISSKTRLIATTHVSNTLGTINPIREIIEKAHQHNIPVFIDGAQAVAHTSVDVQELNCDFYAFSAHKLYGPTGAGVLYGKEKWLRKFPPYQSGGDMIKEVSFERTTYADIPHKFEAGTPNIAGMIGMAEGIDYVSEIGLSKIHAYESELLEYATARLSEIESCKIIGEAHEKSAILSFIVNDVHPSDVGILLDQMGIAVRTGQHCTQPLMARFGIPGTVRASFAFYNTFQEIDLFIEALKRAIKILR